MVSSKIKQFECVGASSSRIIDGKFFGLGMPKLATSTCMLDQIRKEGYMTPEQIKALTPTGYGGDFELTVSTEE